MEKYGLYLPKIFNHQNFNNDYDVPFVKLKNGEYFVPIDFFRELYLSNKNHFNRISSELILRGGEFYLETESPFFPKIEKNNRKVIFASYSMSKDAFQSIDFDLLNIRSFINYFKIEENTFFNQIPLEGFKVLNLNSNDLKILERNLLDVGFFIYECDDDLLSIDIKRSTRESFKEKKDMSKPSKKGTSPKQNTAKNANKTKHLTKINTIKENKMNELERMIIDNRFYQLIDINYLLKNYKYTYYYLNKFDISNISQLPQEKLKEDLKASSLDQINILFNEIHNMILDYPLIATILIDFVKENPELNQYKLTALLNSTTFRHFSRNARSLGIDTIGDFTKDNAQKLFKSNGIGKKKIISFFNILIDYKNISGQNEHKPSENSRINKDILESTEIKRIYRLLNENKFYHSLYITDLNIDEKIVHATLNDGLNHVTDLIKEENIDYLYKLSEKKLKKIFKTLNNIVQDYSLVANKLMQFILNNPSISSLPLKNVLDNSTYRMFIQSARKIGIIELGDFTHQKSINLFETKGIGKKKIISFMNIVFDLPNTSIFNSEDINDDGPKYLAYFMLEEEIPKKHFIGNKITSSSENYLKRLVSSVAKTRQRREKILELLEYSIKDVDEFETTQIAFQDSYQLSAKQILEYLEMHYILEELPNEKNILLQPISKLLGDKLELSNEVKQIILYYEKVVTYFESIETNTAVELFNLKEREQIIFNQRIIQSNPKTLEDLAKILEITRERVRQIEKEIKTKIRSVLSRNNLKLYQKHLYKNNVGLIEEGTLRNILISIDHSAFFYDKEFDVLMLADHKEKYNSIKNEIVKIFKENDFIRVKDIESFVADMTSDDESGSIKKMINNVFKKQFEKSKYVLKNNIILKENINKNKMYYYIIEEYYAREILDLTNDEGYDLFIDRLRLHAPQKMVEDLVNRSKNAAIRSIEGVLETQSDKVLKIDAHQYRKLDVNQIPYSLLDEIYQFIKDEITKNNFVSYKKIYRKFEEEVDQSRYSDKTIYYLIKIVFEEDFLFSGKTAMRIFEKNEKVLTTGEIILSTLDKNNGQMPLNDLTEEIGVEDYTIIQQAENNPYKVSGKSVFIKEEYSELSEDTIQKIKKLFTEMISQKGYVSIKQIYEEVLFVPEINSDLRKNNYDSNEDFRHLLKVIFPETEGHTRILFEKNTTQNYLNVYLTEIGAKNEYHRNDFREAGLKLGLSEQTSNYYLNQFIDDGTIAALNADFFVLSNTLIIEEQTLNAIDSLLHDNFDNKEYISLTKINSKFRQLPRINRHRWTIELMNYVVTRHLSYKKVNISNIHYDADPMIIKQNGSKMTYKEIVNDEVSCFEGNKTEDNILEYMKQKGLIKSSAKSLYSWFFSKGILTKNEFGRINLVEE